MSTSSSNTESMLFVAKWAPLSYMMVKELPAGSLVRIVDVETEPVLADMHEIYSIPTFLVKRGDEEVFRVTGSFSFNDLSRHISVQGVNYV
ncbi:MAG: hypothetical protein ACKOW9_06165 [Candidatus Paceibacterota bacterium]